MNLPNLGAYGTEWTVKSSGSWWRQANGEAIVGPKTGTFLREIPSVQVTLKEWLALHPASLVMQADSTFKGEYAKDSQSAASENFFLDNFHPTL